jgi:acetyl esterase/lipase
MDLGSYDLARAGRLACLALCLMGSLPNRANAQGSAAKASRQSDVVYGRKFGLALTTEVFTPANRNGLGVVWVVSSSGRSSRDQTLQNSFERRLSPLLDRGYTVFAVIHGSAPIFNVLDQLSDVRRAVRFVRYRAAEFGIDGQRPGISGSSAGALLALMVAMQGQAGDSMLREMSPVTHVSADDPPTILIHGDQDKAVPVQQSRSLNERLREARVPARLIVREGMGHAYPGWESDTMLIADWFDEHLRGIR